MIDAARRRPRAADGRGAAEGWSIEIPGPERLFLIWPTRAATTQHQGPHRAPRRDDSRPPRRPLRLREPGPTPALPIRPKDRSREIAREAPSVGRGDGGGAVRGPLARRDRAGRRPLCGDPGGVRDHRLRVLTLADPVPSRPGLTRR